MESDPGDINDRIRDALEDAADDRRADAALDAAQDFAFGDNDSAYDRRMDRMYRITPPRRDDDLPRSATEAPVVRRPNNPFQQVVNQINQLEESHLLGDQVALRQIETSLIGLVDYYNRSPQGMRNANVPQITEITPKQQSDLQEALKNRIIALTSNPASQPVGEALRIYAQSMNQTPENLLRLNQFLIDVDGVDRVIRQLDSAGRTQEAEQIRSALHGCMSNVLVDQGDPVMSASVITTITQIMGSRPNFNSENDRTSTDAGKAWAQLMLTMIEEYKNNPSNHSQLAQADLLKAIRNKMQNTGFSAASELGKVAIEAAKTAGGSLGSIWMIIFTFLTTMTSEIGKSLLSNGFNTK